MDVYKDKLKLNELMAHVAEIQGFCDLPESIKEKIKTVCNNLIEIEHATRKAERKLKEVEQHQQEAELFMLLDIFAQSNPDSRKSVN